MAMNLMQVLQKAMKDAGFDGELSGRFYITFDTPPLSLRDDIESKYFDAVGKVPGVEFDEGQVSGYTFEVIPDQYTAASERKLKKVLARYARFAIGGRSTAPAKAAELGS